MTFGSLRALCAAVFVAGIVTMIVTTVNGNNNGWVMTAGLATAVTALVLLGVSAVTQPAPAGRFVDDLRAARLEAQVGGLVAAGADEQALRRLIREAFRLGQRNDA